MDKVEFNSRVKETFRTGDSEGLRILLEHYRSLPDREKVELWGGMVDGERSREYVKYVHHAFARDTVPAMQRYFNLPEVPFGAR